MKLICYAMLPVLAYAAYLAHVGGERVWCAVFQSNESPAR